MKPAFVALLLLLYTQMRAQNISTIVSDRDIYSFINWLTNSEPRHTLEGEPQSGPKKIALRMLQWDDKNFMTPDSQNVKHYSITLSIYLHSHISDSLFGGADRDYLISQSRAIHDTVWRKPIDHAIFYGDANRFTSDGHLYSVPLFSRDGRYVIIQRDYYCGHPCAVGAYAIYERVDDKAWKQIATPIEWGGQKTK